MHAALCLRIYPPTRKYILVIVTVMAKEVNVAVAEAVSVAVPMETADVAEAVSIAVVMVTVKTWNFGSCAAK